MGLLDRVSTLIRANLNDLVSRAEDPEKVIRQLIMDMDNQLVQVKTQVAASIADEKRLEQHYKDSQKQADDWQRKAELAVQKGEDDLAREALSRRRLLQETATGYQEQYESQHAQVEQLKQALRQLEDKINEAKTKQDLLIARSRRAKAETNIRQTLAGVDSSGALGEFGRMEERVQEQEARAQAYAELDQDTLDTRFRHLEHQDEVDKELEALKSKVGGGSSTPNP
ncbi:MAG: phage shock protein [Chloroflexota bacterium]|jgi:phage shock protein A|nr:phage shock protein [Chloroflexota bacterium]